MFDLTECNDAQQRDLVQLMNRTEKALRQYPSGPPWSVRIAAETATFLELPSSRELYHR